MDRAASFSQKPTMKMSRCPRTVSLHLSLPCLKVVMAFVGRLLVHCFFRDDSHSRPVRGAHADMLSSLSSTCFLRGRRDLDSAVGVRAPSIVRLPYIRPHPASQNSQNVDGETITARFNTSTVVEKQVEPKASCLATGITVLQLYVVVVGR
jgi:hypothetical protein